MLPIKIAMFLPSQPDMREELWSDKARAYARRCGFEMEVIPTSFNSNPEDLALLAPRLKGIRGLITSWGSPLLTKGLLDCAPSLEIIGHAAGSVNNIITDEIYERGIVVTTANGEMAHSVAEWSLAMTMLGFWSLPDHCKFGTKGKMVPYRGPEYMSLRKATLVF